MGRLIVSANMTTDMVIDPLEGWFQPDLAAADGLAQLSAADAIILGRETYEKLAGFWPKSDDEWAEHDHSDAQTRRVAHPRGAAHMERTTARH